MCVSGGADKQTYGQGGKIFIDGRGYMKSETPKAYALAMEAYGLKGDKREGKLRAANYMYGLEMRGEAPQEKQKTKKKANNQGKAKSEQAIVKEAAEEEDLEDREAEILEEQRRVEESSPKTGNLNYGSFFSGSPTSKRRPLTAGSSAGSLLRRIS